MSWCGRRAVSRGKGLRILKTEGEGGRCILRFSPFLSSSLFFFDFTFYSPGFHCPQVGELEKRRKFAHGRGSTIRV